MIRGKHLLLTALCAVVACQVSVGQADFSEKEVLKTLKTFYNEYITEGSRPISREDLLKGAHREVETNLQKIIQKHCTQRFIDELRKYTELVAVDSDPFVGAHDFNADWLKTLKIEKDSQKNNIYHVLRWNGYEKKFRKITLYIVKEGKSYKIDNTLSVIESIEAYKQELLRTGSK